jgi:hypothetical protein
LPRSSPVTVGERFRCIDIRRSNRKVSIYVDTEVPPAWKPGVQAPQRITEYRGVRAQRRVVGDGQPRLIRSHGAAVAALAKADSMLRARLRAPRRPYNRAQKLVSRAIMSCTRSSFISPESITIKRRPEAASAASKLDLPRISGETLSKG